MLRGELGRYVFRVPSEAALQAQVASVLAAVPGLHIDTEVRREGGRFDLLVRYTAPGEFYQTSIVIELKVKGSAAAVERQAQRYAKMDDVDAVAVVTTSNRLHAALMAPGDVGQAPVPTLGGKPFYVIVLRTT